jgi:hemolysin activation/secretion protein
MENKKRSSQPVANSTSIRVAYPCVLLLAAGLIGPQQLRAQDSPRQPFPVPAARALPQFNPWELRSQETGDLFIPPAADRPLGEDQGPKIAVNSVKLDIDPKLAKLIDEEVSKSLKLTVDAALAAHREQGFTIGQLESLAAETTDVLRNAGFILAWAYLPEQTVADQTVIIAVLPGSLEAVKVEGNNRYTVDRLLAPFNPLMGVPVEKSAIENSILNVRNYPGLSTTAVFSPGTTTGSSELTLRVAEDPFDIAFVADNYGTPSTGETRLRAEMAWNNPFGRADSIAANILQTFNPTDNLYGGVRYQTPIFRPDLFFAAAYSHNAFDVGRGETAVLGLGGTTDIASMTVTKNLRYTRRSKFDLSFDLSAKDAKLTGTGSAAQDKLTVLSLELAAEAVDNIFNGGINQLQIKYSQGIPDFLGSMDSDGVSGDALSTRQGGSGQRAGGDFGKTVIRYQRLQRISKSNSLLLRGEGQYTKDILTSLEEFLMGGPNSVRAYPVAEYLMDKGLFASAEWIVDLNRMFDRTDASVSWSLSAFADAARGGLNDPLPTEPDYINLAGYGLGLSAGYTGSSGNTLGLRLDIATPYTSREPTNGRDPQVYGQLNYSFR